MPNINKILLSICIEIPKYIGIAYADIETGQIIFVPTPSGPLRDIDCDDADLFANNPFCFLPLPRWNNPRAYATRMDFVHSLEDYPIKEDLRLALIGAHPFSHFRALIKKDRKTNRSWRKFQSKAKKAFIQDYCDQNGFTLTI